MAGLLGASRWWVLMVVALVVVGAVVLSLVAVSRLRRPGGTLDEQLMHAAAAGDSGWITELIGKGADPNYVRSNGGTPLVWAVMTPTRDRPKAVATLIAHGADPNLWAGPSAPLHYAVRMADEATIVALLDGGAHVNAPVDPRGYTALHYAAQKGMAGKVALLLQRGADPTLRARNGKTPLDLAKEGGDPEVIRLCSGGAVTR
jgi:ankyrin repeat protein